MTDGASVAGIILLSVLGGVFLGGLVDGLSPGEPEPDLTRCVELAGMVYGAVAAETNDTLQAANAAKLWMGGLAFRPPDQSPTDRCEVMFLDWCDDGARSWCGRDFACADLFGRECQRRDVDERGRSP